MGTEKGTKATEPLRIAAALLLAAGMTFSLTGCDDGGVTGTTGGDVSAAVTDAPSPTSGSIARASLLDLFGLQSSGSYSGTLAADARVEVRTQAGTWLDLGSVSDADLQMQSDGGEVFVANGTTVDAGSYTAVRLTLENATTTVEAGSSIGGVVLDASVDIAVGGDDGRVVIEKSIDLHVDGDTRTTVVFDLNSETWVDQSTVDAGDASDSKVRSAATVFTRATAG